MVQPRNGASLLGELEAAEADYDRVIALSPGDAQAYLNRSELRPQTPERNHIEELERALARAAGVWHTEVPLRYALAKEYDDLGNFAESWRHLARGASSRRQHLSYDVRIDLATVEKADCCTSCHCMSNSAAE